ncbi:MAG: thioredoxin [Roseburia sp.]|nr:thioredoxin [Anaeroplasma bactoclasticum]MCM1196186.1 thioredoxin [Roseburia sp.]MCM1556274.1 thioredoxin [Anaeroplasma bactoclasticum]
MSVITVTKDNFNEVVKEGTILLDFWANWCGPCRMLSPVLEQLAEEENLVIGKVNVDEEEELAGSFNISSIPALFLVKDGKVVNKTVGYQPIQALKEFIK